MLTSLKGNFAAKNNNGISLPECKGKLPVGNIKWTVQCIIFMGVIKKK